MSESPRIGASIRFLVFVPSGLADTPWLATPQKEGEVGSRALGWLRLAKVLRGLWFCFVLVCSFSRGTKILGGTGTQGAGSWGLHSTDWEGAGMAQAFDCGRGRWLG